MAEKIDDLFADGVGNIGIQSAIARIELLQLTKVPIGKEPPSYQVSRRLVMSLESMLRLYQGLDEVVKQLEQKDLIRKPGAVAESTASSAGKAKAPSKKK